jgi:hypothetical protein
MTSFRFPVHLAFSVFAVAASGVTLVAACSSSSAGVLHDAGVPPDGSVTDGGADGPDDAATEASLNVGPCLAFDGGGPFVEAPHGPLPTMTYHGGGILQSPRVITFTFPTTPGVSTLEDFGKTLTQTSWFATVSRDYCIDDGGTCIATGIAGAAVEMTTASVATYVDTLGQGSPSTGTDLRAFMNAEIAKAVAAGTIPSPAEGAIYTFYFPPDATVWQGDPNAGGGQSCSAFLGYHGHMTYSDGQTPIVYAIVPDCPQGDPTTDLQAVVFGASHEIIEAVTDPGIPDSLGWYLDEDLSVTGSDGGPYLPVPTAPQIRNDPWAQMLGFGEAADDCEYYTQNIWTLDSGLLVQRVWSPSAAARGQNPCVPVPPGESYYGASPDQVLYVADVGATFTVDVSVFAEASRPSWRLDAFDQTPNVLTALGAGPTSYLQVEFEGGVTQADGSSSLACVNNGAKAQLKVTLLADPASEPLLVQYEAWPEADVFLRSDGDGAPDASDSGVAPPSRIWPFAVVTPATAASIGVGKSGVSDARELAALRARLGSTAGPVAE